MIVQRLAAGLALLAGLLATPTPAATATAAATTTAAVPAVPGPVVLIGTGGVRWDDVDSGTPALFSLLSAGAVGSLAVRSVRTHHLPGRRLAGDLRRPAGR